MWSVLGTQLESNECGFSSPRTGAGVSVLKGKVAQSDLHSGKFFLAAIRLVSWKGLSECVAVVALVGVAGRGPWGTWARSGVGRREPAGPRLHGHGLQLATELLDRTRSQSLLEGRDAEGVDKGVGLITGFQRVRARGEGVRSAGVRSLGGEGRL